MWKFSGKKRFLNCFHTRLENIFQKNCMRIKLSLKKFHFILLSSFAATDSLMFTLQITADEWSDWECVYTLQSERWIDSRIHQYMKRKTSIRLPSLSIRFRSVLLTLVLCFLALLTLIHPSLNKRLKRYCSQLQPYSFIHTLTQTQTHTIRTKAVRFGYDI